MSNLTYYDVLQIKPDAPDDMVRAAYRRLVKLYHPDSNPLSRNTTANARFRMVQDAYEHLRTPQARAAYDQHLKMRAWYSPAPARNDNADAQMSNVFTSARQTLERLLRMMAANRDIGVASRGLERNGKED